MINICVAYCVLQVQNLRVYQRPFMYDNAKLYAPHYFCFISGGQNSKTKAVLPRLAQVTEIYALNFKKVHIGSTNYTGVKKYERKLYIIFIGLQHAHHILPFVLGWSM